MLVISAFESKHLLNNNKFFNLKILVSEMKSLIAQPTGRKNRSKPWNFKKVTKIM